MQIIPAVLTDDVTQISAALEAFRPFSRIIHVDVLDDSLVPGRTVLPDSWPLTSDFRISWHLMVAQPEQYFDDCLRHATAEVIVPAELGIGRLEAVIRALTEARVPTGLAIGPETAVRLIASELPKVQSALVMTITPGAQGNPFRPELLPKLAELRRLAPRLMLAVDGGISPTTVHSLAPYRPARVVVGSFLKPGLELVERWEALQRAAKV